MLYQRVYIESNPGPWTCHFCDAPMGTLEVVHHLDGNGTQSHSPNHAVENLVAAHGFCHRQHHGRKYWIERERIHQERKRRMRLIPTR